MIKFLLLSLYLNNFSSVQNAEILVVNPMPSYSHFIIPFKLAKQLANRGHKVTCINLYPQKSKIENYIDIPVIENIPLIEEIKKTLFNRTSFGFVQQLTSLFDFSSAITNATLHHKNVKQLLESNQKFDVVLIEHFFNEAYVSLGFHFSAPVILISTQAASSMNNYIFANPAPASYMPGSGKSLAKYMNFWERLQNFCMTRFFEALIHFYHLPQQKEVFKSIIKDEEFEDVLYNTSFMLTNSHPSVAYPIPLVPNIVEVAGIHVETKSLPEDLQKYLDEATEGAILFSMGSNLKSQDLKPETRNQILKAFGKLKQKVLWKFETDLPDVPPNVKIAAWLPQQDVLNHKNVKLFISHGGRLSTIESIYFGVPIIGIPVFGDQLSNIANAVADGYAIQLDLETLAEEKLSWAINEILTNPKFKENVQKRSNSLHDQAMKPLDTAVFWVEHVIRNQGANFYRSTGLNLKWHEREMIDIFVFLACVLSLTLLVFCILVRTSCNLIFDRRDKISKFKKDK